MVNKKGYIKTIEAIIAILILLGFFIYMLPNEPIGKAPVPEDIRLMQSIILEEISNNQAYRDCLINDSPDTICTPVTPSLKEFIEKTINPTDISLYSYSFQACSAPNCPPPDLSGAGTKQIYIADSILTDGSTYVIVRLFIWNNQ